MTREEAEVIVLEHKNIILNLKYPPYLTKKGVKDAKKAKLLEEQIISAMTREE